MFTPSPGGVLLRSREGNGVLLWVKPPNEITILWNETPWGKGLHCDVVRRSHNHVFFQSRRVFYGGHCIAPSLSVPESVESASETVNVKLMFKNGGQGEFRTDAKSLRLTIHIGQFTESPSAVIHRDIVVDSMVLAPADSATFEFEVPAPNVPGTYRIDVRAITIVGATTPQNKWLGSVPVTVLRVK